MKKIDIEQARKLAKEIGMDDKIVSHCEGVAKRVQTICEILEGAGHKVNCQQAVIAAILHDAGWTRAHGLDHAQVAGTIIEEHDLKDIAEIVRVHALPQTTELSLEAKVLIYADTTTGPDGNSIDPMEKLRFLERLGEEWKNEKERLLAKEAYEIKRRIVSEIDTMIKRAMIAT